MSSKDVRVVLCTVPSGDAPRIARTVLEDGLVARVDVVTNVSGLRYKPLTGTAKGVDESLLVLKSAPGRHATLEQRLSEMTPGAEDRTLSLDGASGANAYLTWSRDLITC